MNNINKKHMKMLGMLIIVLFCMILALNMLQSLKAKLNQNEIIKSAINGTNWPIDEVPLLVKDGISVSGDFENMYNVSCSNKVNYDEVREYLIELYGIGFKPLKEFGSQNPNYLSENIDNVEVKELLWIAEKDDYTITVLWSDNDANDDVSSLYEYNFEITLFVNSSELNSNKTESIEDFDNISGE